MVCTLLPYLHAFTIIMCNNFLSPLYTSSSSLNPHTMYPANKYKGISFGNAWHRHTYQESHDEVRQINTSSYASLILKTEKKFGPMREVESTRLTPSTSVGPAALGLVWFFRGWFLFAPPNLFLLSFQFSYFLFLFCFNTIFYLICFIN